MLILNLPPINSFTLVIPMTLTINSFAIINMGVTLVENEIIRAATIKVIIKVN